MTTGQAPKTLVFCPDCNHHVKVASLDEFVEHRAREHPPTTAKTLAPIGIRSEMAFGTDPKE